MKCSLRFLGLVFCFSNLLLSCQIEKSIPSELNQEQGGGDTPCQCVAYVKHQLQIPTTTPTANAKDWGDKYFPKGFQLINSTPQVGDLIVLTPDVGAYFSSSQVFNDYGHIAIINAIDIQQNGAYKIEIKGANQGGKESDCGCPNVNVKTFTLPSAYRNTIRVFRKDNPYLCFVIQEIAKPSMQISINSISFGDVNISETSSQTFSIKNSGSAPLIINSINTSNSIFICNYSGTIEVGQSVQVQVKFKPQHSQDYSGQLTINSNSTGNNVISLIGRGKPISVPEIGFYGDCQGSGTVNYVYSTGIINARVKKIDTNNGSITFEFKKCNDGLFSYGGALFVMADIFDTNSIYSNTPDFYAGDQSAQITINESNMSGTKTYYVGIRQQINQQYQFSISPKIMIKY